MSDKTFVKFLKKMRAQYQLGGPDRPDSDGQVHVQVKSPWNPTWTPTITNPIKCAAYESSAFGSPPVSGIAIYGAKFDTTGTVDPASTVPLGDFELGILQVVVASSMVAVYNDAGGNPAWTLTISEQTLPIRDSEVENVDWAKPTTFTALTSSKTVSHSDRPRNVVPWQTKDKKGTLVSSSGADAYSTWLAVRQKSTGAYTALCWAIWTLDWGCTFDFQNDKGSPTGQGNLTGQGTDGQGAVSPITGGKIANKAITFNWSGPAGGY